MSGVMNIDGCGGEDEIMSNAYVPSGPRVHPCCQRQNSRRETSVSYYKDGTDEVMSMSVMEGDSVSLNTDVTEVQNYHLIQWMFGETQIAEINNLTKSSSIYDTDDDKTLKNRLKLDPQTGSLTITHTRTTDSGLYQLILTSGQIRSKSFRVTVSGVFGDVAVKSVSVMEGESVTLNIDVNTVETVETDDQIKWRFRHYFLIALIYRQSRKRKVIDDVLDGRFRGRLELDQTGSLTITDTRTTDSGLYEVKNTNNILYTFSLTVYARLSVPVISHSSQNVSSSEQNCSLLCSVVNVSAVSVSWFRGNSSLSSISVSDLSISLSLPLEIVCLDDSYSCVLNNPISNQTTHLNTELCKPCPDHICSCGFTEAVIRLVLSAVVGVAAVAVLVYDIRSRSLQQKREQTSSSSSD